MFDSTICLTLTIFASKLQLDQPPRLLDSSVGRALHRYRRGHGLEFRSIGYVFLQTFFLATAQVTYLTAKSEDDSLD